MSDHEQTQIERMDSDLQRLKNNMDDWERQIAVLTDRIDKIAQSLSHIEITFQRIEHFWKSFLENLLKFVKTVLKWLVGILTAGLGGAFVTYLVNHFHLVH